MAGFGDSEPGAAAAGSRRADLIVVGAGLIGAAAALGAAGQGRRVLLIERAPPSGRPGRFGMDVRNVAVSPATRNLLESLGVWSALDATPYVGMHVWEEQGVEAVDFRAVDVGREALGWILPNLPAVEALWAALEAHPAVDIVFDAEIDGIRETAGEVVVQGGLGTYRGGLLLGCDGGRSTIRGLLEVPLDLRPTGHCALATLIRTEKPHARVAHQRFLLDGPLALLPSADPLICSVVWSQPPALAAERQAMAAGDFLEAITRASEGVLGAAVDVDDRYTFPLEQHLAADFNPRARVLLLGDAARVLHPLAGLGANVGFEDVREMLDRLRELPPGADAGAPGLWRAFARRRRVRAELVLSMMAGFKAIYSAPGPLPALLRNAGVGWVNRALPLKRRLIREAMGIGPLGLSA